MSHTLVSFLTGAIVSGVLLFAAPEVAPDVPPYAAVSAFDTAGWATQVNSGPSDQRTAQDTPSHGTVTVDQNTLRFSDRFSLNFQRTLRIPDDGTRYPLPPGLGTFPIYRVTDFAGRVPAHWQRKNAFFIPMYQREAMWIDFDGAWWKPNAVKIGVGTVNVLTGEKWDRTLAGEPQNYLVAPDQPWLDGIKAGEDYIRQFVAVPLGSGTSIEAQVRGVESDEALRIAVFEPIPGRFPDDPPRQDLYRLTEGAPTMASKAQSSTMGLGAGGKMRQKVYPDSYGLDAWDTDQCIEAVVYIVNSEAFAEITGEQPPDSPVSVAAYTDYGYPWFDLYDEGRNDIETSDVLRDVKSVGTLDAEQGLPPDSSIAVPDSQVVKLPLPQPGTPPSPGTPPHLFPDESMILPPKRN
jgi:hypothetical protein